MPSKQDLSLSAAHRPHIFVADTRPIQIGDLVQAENDHIYGKDGCTKHLRGNFLGCHPEHQKFGHARAIQNFNIAEASTVSPRLITC